MGRVEKRTYLHEEVAVATLLVPSSLTFEAGWEMLAPLYERLKQEAEVAFRQEVVPRAEQAYQACDDPHKRYRFRGPKGIYTHRITWEREGVLSVLCRFQVRWGEQTVVDRTHGEVWTEQGRLVLPSMVVERRELARAARAHRIGRRKLERQSFYLLGDRAVFLIERAEIGVPLRSVFLPFPIKEEKIRSPLQMLLGQEEARAHNGRREQTGRSNA